MLSGLKSKKLPALMREAFLFGLPIFSGVF
jgi:hypothetical protein